MTARLFSRTLADLDASLVELDAAMARNRTDHAVALAESQRVQQAVSAAEAHVATISQQRAAAADVAASVQGEVTSARAAAAAAAGAQDAAARKVVNHEEAKPDPPEPNEHGAIPPAAAAAFKQRLKKWQDEHAALVAASDAAAGALATARGAEAAAVQRLAAGQAQVDQLSAALAAATAALSAVQGQRDTAAGTVAQLDQGLSALIEQRQGVSAQAERLRALDQLIAADPVDRPAMERTAAELASRLTALRRVRRDLVAGHDATLAEQANLAAPIAASSAELEALRVEFDADLRLATDRRSAAEAIALLTQAVNDAAGRAKTASERLDQTAQQIARHREKR